MGALGVSGLGGLGKEFGVGDCLGDFPRLIFIRVPIISEVPIVIWVPYKISHVGEQQFKPRAWAKGVQGMCFGWGVAP